MNALLCRSAATCVVLLCLGLMKVASVEITVEPGGETIQSALDRVGPGDVIVIESGDYFEDLKTRIHGEEDRKITIKGAGGRSGRDSVVLRGAGESRVFQVMHDYYTLQDFTIDGQVFDDIRDVDEGNAAEAFRDILLYVASEDLPTQRSGGYMSALDGLVVTGMLFNNALSECVRIRNFVTYADIDDNTINNCGLLDFEYADGQNGEGIYLGTARAQWHDTEKNPSGEEDICLGNRIRNNVIPTNGNEGVDVKEGCLGTKIENNLISLQHDENSGGISSHADDTTITGNTIEDAAGAGVRVGTNEPDEDGRYFGVDNTVTDNMFINCAAYGIKIVSFPQREICGNDVELPAGQDEYTYEYSGGDYGDQYEPFEECGDPSTPLNRNTPAPTGVPNTLAPSPAPNTPAPTGVPNTLAPSSAPNTPAPSAMPSTPAPSALPSSPAPSAMPSSPAPYAMPSTPAPSAMPITPAPSAMPSTPAPSAIPSIPDPSTIPETVAPSELYKTPAPTPRLRTPAPSPGPSTATPSAIPGAVYLGCFLDEIGERTMLWGYKSINNMTNEACIEHCKNDGKRFAGTTDGKSCRCTNYETNVWWHGEATNCGMECPQDSAMPCGGELAVTSWEILRGTSWTTSTEWR